MAILHKIKMTLLKTLFSTLSLIFSFSLFGQDITVGGKFFTEQYILAEITTQILEKEGFNVTRKVGLGSNLVRKAQEQGEVDLYWEYTGTSLVAYNKFHEKLSRSATYEKVKELDKEKGIIWLDPADANNTFALAMNKDKYNSTNIVSLSDIAQRYKDENLKVAVTAEFLGRPDGLKSFEKEYDTRFSRSNLVSMDAGLIYQALKDGKVDAGIVFATDGRIAAFDLAILQDDKEFFPDYSLAAVIREDALSKYPQIEDLMNEVASNLNDEALQAMNADADVNKRSVTEVASEFIKNNNL